MPQEPWHTKWSLRRWNRKEKPRVRSSMWICGSAAPLMCYISPIYRNDIGRWRGQEMEMAISKFFPPTLKWPTDIENQETKQRLWRRRARKTAVCFFGFFCSAVFCFVKHLILVVEVVKIIFIARGKWVVLSCEVLFFVSRLGFDHFAQ